MKKGYNDENIELLVEYAKKIIEIADNLNAEKIGFIYTNICKNCGKEIQVARKNHHFCNGDCKKQYLKQQRKELYQKRKQTLTEEQKEKEKNDAIARMRELRKLRRELKEREV